MRKIFISLILISLFAVSSKAEEDTLQYPHERLILRFTPLTLLEYPTIALQLGVEYPLTKNLSLGHDLAYIFPYSGNDIFSIGMNHSGGFKVRTELKNYLNPKYEVLTGLEKYFALEVFYKYRYFDDFRWISMLDGAYTQRMEYNVVRSAGGLHFKYGRLVSDPYLDHFVMDYYLGIGVRFYHEKSDFHESVESLVSDFEKNNEFTFYPSMTIGIKLGYAPKKAPQNWKR